MIAVLGKRYDYEHLCYHVNVHPDSNSVFKHVRKEEDARGRMFSEFLVTGNMDDKTIEDNYLLDFVVTRIRK